MEYIRYRQRTDVAYKAAGKLTKLGAFNAFMHSSYINKVVEKYDVLICDSVIAVNIKHPKCINIFNFSNYGYSRYLSGVSLGTTERVKLLLNSYIERFAARNTYNVAVSNFLKDILEEQGITVHAVINNCVDVQKFKPLKQLSAKRDCLYAGSFSYYGKGFDILEKLAERGVKIDCVTTARNDSKLYFVGMVEHRKMPEMYNRYRIAVYPSRFETFGLVPLEAMACGLPVVVADVGVARELKKVIPEFVVNGYDDRAVDEYMKKLAIINSNYDDFSKKAREYVIENYSLEKFIVEWLGLVDEIHRL